MGDGAIRPVVVSSLPSAASATPEQMRKKLGIVLPPSLASVRTGDALLFSGNSPTGFLLKTFVSSQWNHAGIAVRLHNGEVSLTGEGELYIYETNTGVRWDNYFNKLMLGAAFSHVSFVINKYNTVACRPLLEHLRTPQLAQRTIEFARITQGNRFPSSALPFLSVWLGIPLQNADAKGSDMFCSELMANYYAYCFGSDYLAKTGRASPKHAGPLTREEQAAASRYILYGLFGQDSPGTFDMYTPGHFSYQLTPFSSIFAKEEDVVYQHYSDLLYIILQLLVITGFILVIIWMSLPDRKNRTTRATFAGRPYPVRPKRGETQMGPLLVD